VQGVNRSSGDAKQVTQDALLVLHGWAPRAHSSDSTLLVGVPCSVSRGRRDKFFTPESGPQGQRHCHCGTAGARPHVVAGLEEDVSTGRALVGLVNESDCKSAGTSGSVSIFFRMDLLTGTASARTSDLGASVRRVRGRWILKILNRQPLDLKTTR
jgi:hypothetical protein